MKTVRFVEAVMTDEEEKDEELLMNDDSSGESTHRTVPGQAEIECEQGPVPTDEESVPDDGGKGDEVNLDQAQKIPVAVSNESSGVEYKRLFTEKELTAIEMNQWDDAEPESEEYDKELEDKLYPLDEENLERRLEENALSLTEPSLLELSDVLGIPVDVLERTRDATLGEMGSPEYWLKWYENTLASTAEAKRANRNFQDAVENGESVIAQVNTGESSPRVTDVKDSSGNDSTDGQIPEVTADLEEGRETVVICNIGVRLDKPDQSVEVTPEPRLVIPMQWRSLARRTAYELALEREKGPDPAALGADRSRSGVEKEVAFDEARATEVLERIGGKMPSTMRNCVVGLTEDYYYESASEIRVKLRVRWRSDCEAEREQTPSLDNLNYCNLFNKPINKRKRRPGLRIWDPGTARAKVPEGVPKRTSASKRYLCSVEPVEGIEATSMGYIDCLPSELLMDTGAFASLIDDKVLKRLGLLNAPLKPYSRSLTSASGNDMKIRGEIDLPLRLGSVEKTVPFVVTNSLHVDAILGMDVLAAFRAVIDTEEKTLTLKETGEVFRLGMAPVAKVCSVWVASPIRLKPGHQVLTAACVDGEVGSGTVTLVEGVSGAYPKLRVARSICTIQEGRVIVELCNASTEEIVISKGAVVANTTILPDSTFTSERERERSASSESEKTVDISAVIGGMLTTGVEDKSLPGLSTTDRHGDNDELEVDFSGSKLNEEQRAILRTELNKFRDLFVETSKKPGRTDLLKFSIDTGDHAPVKQRPYRVSQAEGAVMEAEIQQYLELGIIRPSTSPWASPVLMIRKPDGGIRFCIDYRRLNALTVKDSYPMPLIDDILDVLGNARLFSTMDIASGYWNVPMANGSIEKTAFTCKYGLYEWLVMPFGLCNAVPAFERLMETVLIDLKWRTCLVYLDDCVVFSSDFPTHLERLRLVLERFRAAGFKLKMKKCHWGRSQVAFLGHIVTPSGILPNPEKVKAVLNVLRPHDLHTLRAFLGLTSYFRRYIPGYAAISAPLERLKQKEVMFMWDSDCEIAFQQLKKVLVKPPILAYPDFSKRFKLYVDSSRLAVGACLMQTVEGKDRVVAYASKLLVGSQKNWIRKTDGITEIECWGIVWATRKFRCYLDRTEFDLFTDHKALTWVFSPENRTSNAKLARWAMELSQLSFKVFHKPGTTLGHVDGLSRMHCASVCAITIDDLLNAEEDGEVDTPALTERRDVVADPEGIPASSAGRGVSVSVGEPLAPQDTRSPEERTPEPGEETMSGEDVRVLTSLDEFGLDRAKFKEEQANTPWICAMRAFIEVGALAIDPQIRTKILRTASNYEVKNGILMRRVHLRAAAGPAETISVPVIPLPFIETVLHYLHRDIFSAHVGVRRMIFRVRRHAYWHGWAKDVHEYVEACNVCSGGKGYRPWKNGLMQRMPVQKLNGPFSLLVVDAIGPLITTPRGNKYILVFADYFTRWVEAFPVACLDSVTFIDTMINGVISRHGVPDRLLSDRGSNFTSELAKAFYETLGIKKLFGAAYHPQTQGLVERFNGTLLGMVKLYVNETQSDWDLLLPRLLFAYRTSYHEALGDTPFFSLYGRDATLPIDVAFLNTTDDWQSNDIALYRRQLFNSFRDRRRTVERQLLKAQDRHQRRLNDQVAVTFEEGEAVWVYQYFRAKRSEKKTRKLAFSWHGPYRVVGSVGNNAYKVAIPTHPDKIVTINVNRLKPFKGRWSRPFADEVPDGVGDSAENDEGPLLEEDLPSTSFAEDRLFGGDELVITGVDEAIVDLLARRIEKRELQYLVLTANYKTAWVPCRKLEPYYKKLINAFENRRGEAEGLPTMRRSTRLADANAVVDDDDFLF